MMNPLPILLIGGGALLLLSGKKRTRTKKKKPSDSDIKDLPAPDEDMDQTDPDRKVPSDSDPDRKVPSDSDPSPAPAPAPAPKPKPAPTPVPDPEEVDPGDPDPPSSKPLIGPTGVGSCANSIYSRDPQYITPDITVTEKALTEFPEAEYYFYIRKEFQSELYNYMLQRFTAMKSGQERRTVASVILREALKHFNSGCKWETPIDLLSEPEKLVWQGGRRLAIMAQITAGITDPGVEQLFSTSKRFSITRESLNEPDPGFFGAQKKPEPDTRVEILVTDPSQENAEHIIGKVLKLTGPNGEPDQFEIGIVGAFQGANVSPNLGSKHGFKVGSNAYFSQKGPTGIYRIFPHGTT